MTPCLPAILADSASLSDFMVKDYGIIFTLCLMAIHISAPYFQGVVERHEREINSLGRGLAVTYVFLHLFHEIAEIAVGDNVFGPRVYLLMLVGFVLYYGLEHQIEKKITHESADPKDPLVRAQFGTLMLFKWIYSWLIIYSIPSAIREDGLHLIPGLIAVCLHILHDDVELASRFKQLYQHQGRFLLALAPLAGWGAHRAFHPHTPLMTHLLTAFLAGSILYSTFSGELHEHRKSMFRWFVVGILCYAGLTALSGGLKPPDEHVPGTSRYSNENHLDFSSP